MLKSLCYWIIFIIISILMKTSVSIPAFMLLESLVNSNDNNSNYLGYPLCPRQISWLFVRIHKDINSPIKPSSSNQIFIAIVLANLKPHTRLSPSQSRQIKTEVFFPQKVNSTLPSGLCILLIKTLNNLVVSSPKTFIFHKKLLP